VDEKKESKKGAEYFSSSTDEESPDALSKNDIQKVKKLIADQDKQIETLKAQGKQYKE
jgi:hypothetical protein